MNIKNMKPLLASAGMKFLLLSLTVMAVCNSNYGQSDNKISIGEVVSIQSAVLNENRKIWIYLPPSARSATYAKRQYPVVYLLDGDGHFSSVVGMIQQLSTVNGNMISPEMIVVGIPNTDRTRDLTPTHVATDPVMGPDFVKTSGGGEKFLSFIETELIPYVDSKYPTAPYRMLIGHSLGGLTVMEALVRHTGLFNSYVAIDPSMWWDDQVLLKETKKALAEKPFAGRSLYLGIANTMEEGMNIKTVRNDKSDDTKHIRSILDLRDYLEANKQNGLRYQGKYYAGDDHGSVPLIAEYDALHFFFDFYRLKLTGKDFTDPTVDLADKYEKHFRKVSEGIGYDIKPTEAMINSTAYQLLAQKQFKKAEGLFKLNVKNYPASFNVFDSYGDYFVAMGDTKNAIAQFEKVLTLKDNAATKKKLEKLQGK